MPKTFHFKTTFDVKLVLQDAALEEVQRLLAAIDEGDEQEHLIDQKRTGAGKLMDERIALMARATLRNGVANILAEEYPEGYTFSPAKVTQLPNPRIEAAKALKGTVEASEECTGEGTCLCQADFCEYI